MFHRIKYFTFNVNRRQRSDAAVGGDVYAYLTWSCSGSDTEITSDQQSLENQRLISINIFLLSSIIDRRLQFTSSTGQSHQPQNQDTNVHHCPETSISWPVKPQCETRKLWSTNRGGVCRRYIPSPAELEVHRQHGDKRSRNEPGWQKTQPASARLQMVSSTRFNLDLREGTILKKTKRKKKKLNSGGGVSKECGCIHRV